MFFNRVNLNWKYAVGEIALITIGVLLALAVENAREYRNDRRLEGEYIARIENDLRDAIEIWHSHTRRLKSAINLIEAIREGTLNDYREQDGADLWSSYNVSHWSYIPAIPTSAFEELVSTGRLAIIEDIELRNAIAQFYALYAGVQESASDYVEEDYSRLARMTIPYEVVYAADVLESYDVPAIRSALAELAVNPEFAASSNAQLSWHSLVIGTLQITEIRASRLLNQIEQVSNAR